MCRSAADGGRRCPNSSRSESARPPADGKTRTEVHTSKRSYSVIGGESRVPWLPGEKVESIDVIEPGQRPAAGHEGDDGSPRRSKAEEDRAAAEERAADTRKQIAEGKSITEILRARVREQALGVRAAADQAERESQAGPGKRIWT